MRGEFGYVTVRGERLPLTLRGYMVLIVAGGVLLAGGVWLVLSVIIVAFSPLYG